MADKTNSHSYEITIKLESSEGNGTKKKQNGSPKSFIAEAYSKLKNSSPVVGIAFKESEAFVKRSIAYHISNVGLTTGNSESQERAQFMYSAGGSLLSIGVSAITGNWAGVVAASINNMMSVYFNQAQIDLRQSIENESLALSRQRAGIAFNSSRMKGAE